MKATEVRAMPEKDLRNEVGRIRKELFKLRNQRATEKLTNARLIRATRKDLARVLTIMKERGIDPRASGERI